MNDDILIGLSPGGGGADPGSIDLTATSDSGSEATIYELFTDDPPSVDLQNSTITFTPNGSGGFGIAVTAGGFEVPTEIFTDNLTFGNAAEATIQGVTFEDLNANGLQDAGEPALPGVDVTLTGSTRSFENVDLTVTSDSDGLFEFTGLAPSDSSGYTLTQTPPAGFSPTTLNTSNVVSSGDTDTTDLGSIMGSVPNAFTRLAPLGSSASRSQGNTGDLPTASDTETFTFFAAAEESYAAQITPNDAGATLTVTVTGVSGSFTSPAAGEPVILPPQLVAADQGVAITVATDVATPFRMDVFRNTAFEQQVGDSADGNELAIDANGVASVIGTSVGVAVLFQQSNDAAAFVDISSTGTALGLGDEGEATITTTVGNLLFPAGDVTVGNNGGILAGGGRELSRANQSLPDSSLGNALLVLWDDIDDDTGNVYWEERDINGINTLIVQWDNRPQFINIGNATFQLQLFETGPVLARYAYPDIDFGNASFDGGASATIGVQLDSATAVQFSRNSAVLMNDDVLDVLPGVTEIDEYTISLTEMSPVDIVLAGHSVDFSGQTLELLGTDGTTVVATALPDSLGVSSQNFDLGILDFMPSVTGTYTVRLTSSISGDYGLHVSDGTTFEAEPNNSDSDPLRSLSVGTTPSIARGFLSGFDVDTYEVDLAVDQPIRVTTATLFDTAGVSPVNSLDPRLEIVHPDGSTVVVSNQGSAGDGKNDRASFVASEAGTYQIRVLVGSGSGEYEITVEELPPETLDIDGDNGTIGGGVNVATDGILALRYLFGFRGDALAEGAVGTNSTATPAEIETTLDNSSVLLDVDGNGVNDPATDGILLLRYMFGFRGDALVNGAVGAGATRTTGDEVEAWLDQFVPIAPPPPSSKVGSNKPAESGVDPLPLQKAGSVAQMKSDGVDSPAPSAAAIVNSFVAEDKSDDLFDGTADANEAVVEVSKSGSNEDSTTADEFRSWLDAVDGTAADANAVAGSTQNTKVLDSSLSDDVDLNDLLVTEKALLAGFNLQAPAPAETTSATEQTAVADGTEADTTQYSEQHTAETDSVDLVMAEWATAGTLTPAGHLF